MKNLGLIWKNVLGVVSLLALSMTANGAMCPVETYINGDNSIDVEYKKTGTTEYCIVISSTKTMSGLGGSFASTSGGNIQLNTVQVVSADGHTIAIPLTSSTDPVIYTPIYVMMPGEVNFGQPAAITWCNVTLPPVPTNGSALAIYSSHYCGGTTPASCINPEMDYYSASHYQVKDYWLTSSQVVKHYSQMGVEVGLVQNGVMVNIGGRDISSYLYLHVDFYIPDVDVEVTTLGVDLQENNQWYIASTNLQYDQWMSFDIPMSAFTTADKTDINRIRFRFAKSYNNGTWTYQDPATEGYYQVYVDNMYLYVPEGPRVANLSATPTVNSATLTWSPANFTVNPSVYTVQYSSDGGTNWTTASMTATSPYVVMGLNSAVDYTFKVSGVSGLEEAEATVDATTTLPLPPTYTHFPDDVLSIYSTQYGEEIAGAYQGAAWSDATNGTYAIDGSHTVKKYDMAGGANSNKGILWLVDELGAAFGDYDKLHVDLFIPDNTVTSTITKIAIWGGELNGTPVYETSLTLNAWNSFDVPISSFGRSNTNRLCIVPMVGDGYPDTPYTLYMDNYFVYNGDETCEFSKELIDVQNTTRIEGAGAMIYFDGYGSDYARNTAHYTVTARASDGAMTPNIQAATADYLYVTLGRAPGANELTEIILTHQDGAAVKMKFQGGTLVSTRDVCGLCPDSPEPQHDENDVKHLYVSRYVTVNNLTDLDYYSNSVGSTYSTNGGLNVLKFAVTGTSNNTVMVNCNNGTLLDVSGNDYLHVDIFFPDNGTIDSHYLRVGLQQQYYTIPTQEIVLGRWNSFDIPLNAFNVADYSNMNGGGCNCFRASLDPVVNLSNTQPSVPYNIYVDNWYFYAVEGCDASAPAEAAADPDDDADAVISFFSDSYETGVASLTTNNGVLFGFTGTAELVEVTTGNYAYKYDGFSHLGFQVPTVDISDKHGFCFDIWAEKPVAFSIRGGNNNLNRDFGSYEVSCGWNHIEVMFTPEQKSAMNNRLSQLAIDLPKNNQTMPIPSITFIDNLYLFTEPFTFTFTKRLAAQRVIRVQTDGLMRRVQVYNQALTQKLRDIPLATPAGSCSIDIHDLPTGNYVVYVYDTLGRVADVKAVHVVY